MINFEKSAYRKTVKEEPELNDKMKITRHVQNTGVAFHYGQATRDRFDKHHTDANWWGRKFIAIPAALTAIFIKSTYHLATAFFKTTQNILSSNKLLTNHHILKLSAGTIARDLQEGYGWIATLINDSHGQFFVQQSSFQKSCYAYAESYDSSEFNKVEFDKPIILALTVNMGMNTSREELKLLPKREYSKLNIDEFSKKLIKDLFNEDAKKNNLERFAMLDINKLKKAYLNNKLNDYHLSLMSDKQKQYLGIVN